MTQPQINLVAERINRGLSVLELAEQVGTSAMTIRRAESGERMPRPKVAKRIADLYGVKVTDIWPLELVDGDPQEQAA
jgi:transcriptional regulator with XRE-family HTH domain